MPVHDTTCVDRSDEPWRWVCPDCQSTDWDRTNNHAWCPTCQRRHEHGAAALDPEKYELLDRKRDQTIPYAAIRFEEDG